MKMEMNWFKLPIIKWSENFYSDYIKVIFECPIHGKFTKNFTKSEITDVSQIVAICSKCEDDWFKTNRQHMHCTSLKLDNFFIDGFIKAEEMLI